MSEQGWREFLAAEGIDDWVVLHGGATAGFRVPWLGEAAQLAEAVAQVPGLEGSGTLLTIADGRLSVRLTRGVFRLEERHIALAREDSAIARAHGAVVDRTGAQEVQLAIAAKPAVVDVGFWRAVLGYTSTVLRLAIRAYPRRGTHSVRSLAHPSIGLTTLRRTRTGRRSEVRHFAACGARFGATSRPHRRPAASTPILTLACGKFRRRCVVCCCERSRKADRDPRSHHE